MTERVVDVLESVQVANHHRGTCAAAGPDATEDVAELLMQETAVDQTGEGVVAYGVG